MTQTLACPRCRKEGRFDRVELVNGEGTDTYVYMQIYCQCSNEPVMNFVVDLTPEFTREEV
jgi:hypothetical protein